MIVVITFLQEEPYKDELWVSHGENLDTGIGVILLIVSVRDAIRESWLTFNEELGEYILK